MKIVNWFPGVIDLARGQEVKDPRGGVIGTLEFDGRGWTLKQGGRRVQGATGQSVWGMCWLLNMIGGTAEVPE